MSTPKQQIEPTEQTEIIEQAKSLTELKAEAYDLIAQKEQLVNTANYIQELLNQKNAEIQALMSQSESVE